MLVPEEGGGAEGVRRIVGPFSPLTVHVTYKKRKNRERRRVRVPEAGGGKHGGKEGVRRVYGPFTGDWYRFVSRCSNGQIGPNSIKKI